MFILGMQSKGQGRASRWLLSPRRNAEGAKNRSKWVGLLLGAGKEQDAHGKATEDPTKESRCVTVPHSGPQTSGRTRF